MPEKGEKIPSVRQNNSVSPTYRVSHLSKHPHALLPDCKPREDRQAAEAQERPLSLATHWFLYFQCLPGVSACRADGRIDECMKLFVPFTCKECVYCAHLTVVKGRLTEV